MSHQRKLHEVEERVRKDNRAFNALKKKLGPKAFAAKIKQLLDDKKVREVV